MSLSHSTPLVPRRGRTVGAAVATVALLIAAWHPGLHRDAHAAEPAKAPPAVPVRLATVQPKDVPLAMTGMGSVLPMASVTVRTRVDGQLEAVNFKEGQDVKAGQVLARLDARALQAALAQAQGTLARDNATLANARADLQRYTELQQQDAATRQQLDTQAALVRQLTATVQSDTAAVSAAQVQLSYATLAAPLSGRIGARLVDPGNIVHATDAAGLLVINQIDPIAVQFTLPESAFQAINTALHGPAPLQVQAIDRATHQVLATGDLTLLNNQIDVTTGTIAMKARFANPDHKLWPGQSVDARLVLGQQRDALTVPAPAVQRGPNGLFSYVVDAEGKARVQPIEVGSSEGNTAVVTKGLKAGDRVVTDGQFRLAPGTAVREAREGGEGKGAAPGADKPGTDKPAGAKAASGQQGAAS